MHHAGSARDSASGSWGHARTSPLNSLMTPRWFDRMPFEYNLLYQMWVPTAGSKHNINLFPNKFPTLAVLNECKLAPNACTLRFRVAKQSCCLKAQTPAAPSPSPSLRPAGLTHLDALVVEVEERELDADLLPAPRLARQVHYHEELARAVVLPPGGRERHAESGTRQRDGGHSVTKNLDSAWACSTSCWSHTRPDWTICTNNQLDHI